MAELFKPLPSMVVAHYVGVPEEDRQQFDGWTEPIVSAASSGSAPGASQAVTEMLAYFAELIERRRTDPGDDTVSQLVASGVADDDRGLLSILAYVFTMVAGGNDTTTGMLGGAVQLLHERPDQRALLVDDPSWSRTRSTSCCGSPHPCRHWPARPPATWSSTAAPSPRAARHCCSTPLPTATRASYGPDAEQLDVRRRPGQILTFGQGNHFCLGANAAKMQARVALEELLACCPDFEVDIEAVVYAPGPYVRRPSSVPFRVR